MIPKMGQTWFVSYVNVQSIQPVKHSELTRKAPGQFDARVLADVRLALKRWLQL
jgi:hypothetical protein